MDLIMFEDRSKSGRMGAGPLWTFEVGVVGALCLFRRSGWAPPVLMDIPMLMFLVGGAVTGI